MAPSTRGLARLAALTLLAAAAGGACSGGGVDRTGGSVARPSSASGTASPTAAATTASATPTGATTSPTRAASGPAPARAELPRGGAQIFPRHRLVGFAGAPDAEALGRLGIGDIDARAAELMRQARPYAQGRAILPVFELIATLSHRTPGRDGQYRSRAQAKTVESYLAAARRHRGLLLLNIQPGRADFLPEVKAYERWLRHPDVGVALDPEWAVAPGQTPGRVYGSTTGRELDAVAAYLERLVAEHRLPEKVMVFHQVAASVVRGQSDLKPHPGVVIIKSVDGIGGKSMKIDTWRILVRGLPKHIHPGFKLFYVEDSEGPWRLMTPQEVLALRPQPEYVIYE